MNSMTSRLRDNFVFKHYAYNCKRNKRIWIVLTVLNAIGFPLFNLTALDNNGMGIITVISIMSQIAACASGIFLVYSSFDYLYNKSLVDMAFSAPLTSSQRFWSNFASGITVYLSPYIGGCILGCVIGSFVSLTETGKEVFQSFPIYPTMMQLMTVVLLAMIMLYVMTLLVVVCCGNLFESVAYTIVINAIIPIAISVTVFASLMNIFGLNNDSLAMDLISFTSPFGIIMGIVYLQFGGAYTPYAAESYSLGIWQLRYILPIVLTIAAIVALSFLLFKRRKAEHTGRPFVFKLIYYILISAVTYSIIALFFGIDDSVEAFFGAIILSSIVYLIAEVITNRGFKRFGWSVLRYTMTIALSSLFILVLRNTNLFGFETRLPSANNIKYAEISYSGYYNNFGLPSVDQYYYRSNMVETPKYYNAEDIEIITNLHEQIINDHKNGVEYNNSYSYSTIEINYTMKFGLPMIREYRVPDEVLEMFKSLDTSTEFKTEAAKTLASYVERSKDISLANIYYGGEQYIFENFKSEYGINTKELAEAFYKDIMEETEKDYFAPTQAPIAKILLQVPRNEGSFNGGVYGYSTEVFYIKANYTNAIEYLTSHGLGDYIESNKSQSILPDELYGLFLIAPPEGNNSSSTYYSDVDSMYAKEYPVGYYNERHFVSSNYFSGSDYNQNLLMKRLLITDKVRELLSVAQPIYKTDVPCYMIGNEYTNQTYLIPPEYSALAAEVFASADAVSTSIDSDLEEKYFNMGIKLEWDVRENAYWYYSESIGLSVYVTLDGEEYFYSNDGTKVFITR